VFFRDQGEFNMSLAVLKSRALMGMAAPRVTVEVHLANGLPSFNIVGLPEAEVILWCRGYNASCFSLRFYNNTQKSAVAMTFSCLFVL
jgi:hypothetical protein